MMWIETARMLDYHGIVFYLGPGLLLLFIAASLAATPPSLVKKQTPILAPLFSTGAFVMAVALCLIAFRWPGLLYAVELNPDESWLIANARKFIHAPMPWVAADNTTSGPMNSYILMWPHLFGLDIDYGSIRLTGIALLIGILLFSSGAIRTLCNEQSARLAIVPSLVILGLPQSLSNAYATEIFPIALLAAATFFHARALKVKRGRLHAYAAGLALGFVPFAKLQAAPLALLIFGFTCWGLSRVPKHHQVVNADDRPFKIGLPLALFIGAATGPLVFAILLSIGHGWNDFWQSYILMPRFISSRPLSLTGFARYIPQNPGFAAYAALMLLIGLLPNIWVRWKFSRSPERSNDAWIAFVVLYLFTALYVIWKGGNPWTHYLFFLVHPLSLMTGLMWHRASGTAPGHLLWQPASFVPVFFATTIFLLLTTIYLKVTAGDVRHHIRDSLKFRADPITQRIQAWTHGDEHFSVWGYMPQYYVRTGLYPSTRDAMTQFQIYQSPMKNYYLQRYIRDFRASQPNVLVVATGPGNFDFYWDADPSLAAVPGLAEIVRQEFTLVDDFPHCGGIPETQIYVRNTRLVQLDNRHVLTPAIYPCP